MNDFSVLPSALAYLYGDVMQDLFAGRSRLSFSETLPCRDVKVKRHDLAVAMLVTAFVYLVRKGKLALTLQTKGRIIKSRFVLATRSGSSEGDLGGLEGHILGVVRKEPKSNDVQSVVWRLWGDDLPDPYGDVIHMGQAYLLDRGYMAEGERKGITKILGKKLIPQCDRILPLQPEAQQLRSLVASFRAEQPELYAQLWKDVPKGINSRAERPDAEADF